MLTCNPSTQEEEARESEVQDSEVEASITQYPALENKQNQGYIEEW